MQVELKKIKVWSLLLSALPLAMLFIAIGAGLVIFIFWPDPMLLERFEPWQRRVAAAAFSLIWTLFWIAIFMIIAFIYNLLVGFGLPGLKVVLSSPESEAPEHAENP